MYDLLIVGAGLTAATLAAVLKRQMRICVVDWRTHLGGNCFDEHVAGSRVHRYGPHIFHCSDERIVKFLSQFTEWMAYEHRVVAEIEDERPKTKDERAAGETPALRYVPFPYCGATVRALGRQLSAEEVVEIFFRGYSRKMWGMDWGELPASVRGRVPRELSAVPRYYRDSFVALPRWGYTRMMENMLDGVEVILGVGPEEWVEIPAREVVYTGRADLIPVPGGTATLAERARLELDYRTVDIVFGEEHWPHEAVCVHSCTMERAWTRKTNYAVMTGGGKDERQKTKDECAGGGGEPPKGGTPNAVVSTETPRAARAEELTPFYPVEVAENRRKYEALAGLIRLAYPHVHLAGRLGTYRYLDMHQAVAQARTLAETLGAAVREERRSLQYA
jgi:UDP-galactopyranose mutase